MPKETISYKDAKQAGDPRELLLAEWWSMGDKVVIRAEHVFENAPGTVADPPRPIVEFDLNRFQVNYLIKTLRRARAKAFGSDRDADEGPIGND